MVTLELEMLIGLMIVAALAWLCLFAAALILRKACARRRICPKLVNTKTRNLLLIIIAGSILSFIVANNIIEAHLQTDISATITHLKTCDSLKIRNSFYDRGSVSGNPVTEDILVENQQAIEKLANILANSQYKPLLSPGGPSRIGTEELMDIYVYNQQVEIDSFRVIAGHILIIHKEPTGRRYRSLDEDLLTKLREVVGAGGDWLGTRY